MADMTPEQIKQEIERVLALRAKATPGPWQYDDGITDKSFEPPCRGKPQTVSCTATQQFGVLVADLYSGNDPRAVPPLDVSDANGRLIAAAHDMADLLTAVLPMLDALDEVRDAVLHGRGPLEAVLDNDQTNAVLSVIDAAIDAARKQENT